MWDSKTQKPMARDTELVVEELGEELMVYDQRNDQVHCLNPAVSRVWRACDGTTSAERLGPALNLEPELVGRAIGELEACGLLDNGPAGVTRRDATAKLAKMGAAAAAAPLIYSIAAPTPALAATNRFCQGTLGCQPVTTGKGDTCPNCSSQGCACCYLSPNMCSPLASISRADKQNSALCVADCTNCNLTLVVQTCNNCNCVSGSTVAGCTGGTGSNTAAFCCSGTANPC